MKVLHPYKFAQFLQLQIALEQIIVIWCGGWNEYTTMGVSKESTSLC